MHARRRVGLVGRDRTDGGWRAAVIPAEALCVGVRPACRFTLAFVGATQIADGAHAQLIQLPSIVGREIAQDPGAEHATPLEFSAVERAIAAEIAKIAAAF